MKASGLVRENGGTRPADFAEDLMAEAVDGAVELIVGLMEERSRQGKRICVSSVKTVLDAVDERVRDWQNRIELLDGGREGRHAEVAAFRQRLGGLAKLRRRVEGLAGIEALSCSGMEGEGGDYGGQQQ